MKLTELYVIIQCGYEGIEHLTYATLDKDDAIAKINELRERIVKAKEHRKEVLGENYNEDDFLNDDDAWTLMYYDKKITHEEFNDSLYVESDSYCIQKWDGEKFACVCAELKCSPGKTWYM